MAGEKNIVLVPFMAQGHLIPFMALARLLVERTPCTVTLVTTPLNVQTLKLVVPAGSHIEFAELPFNSADHGFPEGCEGIERLPFDRVLPFLQATETLRPAFERYLTGACERRGRESVCVIGDFLTGWSVDVGKKEGLFTAVFVTGGGFGYAVYFSVWMNQPQAKTPAEEFSLPDFPEAGLFRRARMPVHEQTADGSDDWSVYMVRQVTASYGADAFLINTAEEIDKLGMEYFRKRKGMRSWAIGPMDNADGAGRRPEISAARCTEWLDCHPPSTVLYIAFGSWNTITATQMKKLAAALLATRRPFIWVVLPPAGYEDADGIRPEWFPDCFQCLINERKQGLLVLRWAPQPVILSHCSTGAFLSHCGWNSVCESLRRGVPLIGWPISAEQFYNSKMLVECLGVSIEIAAGNRDDVDEDHLACVIESVIGDTDTAEQLKRRTLEVKKMMEDALAMEHGRNGSSINALDAFINSIPSL